jgi:hypothetical protein
VVTGPLVYDETFRYRQNDETILRLAAKRDITQEKLERWMARRSSP